MAWALPARNLSQPPPLTSCAPLKHWGFLTGSCRGSCLPPPFHLLGNLRLESDQAVHRRPQTICCQGERRGEGHRPLQSPRPSQELLRLCPGRLRVSLSWFSGFLPPPEVGGWGEQGPPERTSSISSKAGGWGGGHVKGGGQRLGDWRWLLVLSLHLWSGQTD